MPNYSNSKIYTIRSHQTEKVYIGSTAQTLSQRLAGHRADYKAYLNNKKHNYVTSFEIIKYDDAYIELIETFSCVNKDELRKKEGEYIRKLDCINKYVAGRTTKKYQEEHKEEIREQRKQYREENKEEIKEQKKEFYENNKEKILKQKKENYEKNKDKLLEKKREYYEKNKEELNQKKKENKYTCGCGVVCLKCTKARHERSKKHIKWVEENK